VVLRHQGALPRARAAGVALLRFVVGTIVNIVTTALIAPGGMVRAIELAHRGCDSGATVTSTMEAGPFVAGCTSSRRAWNGRSVAR
jgi:hypothetical protein